MLASVAATDVSALPVPDLFAAHIARTDRETTVSAQSVTVDLGWWGQSLHTRSLPGVVVNDVADTTISGAGRGPTSRATLFALADAALADDAPALTLLWSALAWGAGTSARNMNRRLDAVADHPGAAGLLRTAAEMSRSDPSAAYEVLRPKNRNLLPYLGPAFFSKFLYFAGGGDPFHPCLILDARVTLSLRRFGWASLHPGGAWPVTTYQRYCDLLLRWATEASTATRPVAADELELWLFRHG